MHNYFNYFTEIEDRFQGRRGSLLMLSTLDWALIDTWREAGLPLEVVLRGIDEAFDGYDRRAARARTRLRKVNGLAWCAQAVMESAQRAAEASLASPSTHAPGADPAAAHDPGHGTAQATPAAVPRGEPSSGFEPTRIAAFLRGNADQVAAAALPEPADRIAAETATRLRALALSLETSAPAHLEELDRSLSVLEEKLLAAILTATSEADLTALREHAARELAPFRGKMQAVQIRQVEQQFLGKRLFENHRLPRLSLFYMSLT